MGKGGGHERIQPIASEGKFQARPWGNQSSARLWRNGTSVLVWVIPARTNTSQKGSSRFQNESWVFLIRPPQKKKSTQANLLPLYTTWNWLLISILPSKFVSYSFCWTLAKRQPDQTLALPFFTSWCMAPAWGNGHRVTAFTISADRIHVHEFYDSSPWAFKLIW